MKILIQTNTQLHKTAPTHTSRDVNFYAHALISIGNKNNDIGTNTPACQDLNKTVGFVQLLIGVAEDTQRTSLRWNH